MTFTAASPATSYSARTHPAAHQSTGSNNAARDEPYYFEPFGDDGLTFGDILDVINPLQHIPLLSTLYREWTGDEIDPVPRIAGGALFGGVVGAITSLVNVIVDELSGNDIGEHAFAFAGDLLGGGDDNPAEMYAGDAVPLEVAAGARPSPAPVDTAFDVLDWPNLMADPASGGSLRDLKSGPAVGTLEKRMASVRQGQVTDSMIMAMSMYEKNDHSATERIMPKIDILS